MKPDLAVQQEELETALQHCIEGKPDKSYEILKGMKRAEAAYNLGWHEIRRGNFKKGMGGLSIGRFLNVFGSPPLETDKTIWKDEPLEGKKILLRGEGGYGDEIINVRFARDFKAKGADVTVSCASSLMPLFRTLPYVDSLIHSAGAKYADFDYWVPAMSAPLVLQYEYEDLTPEPYIPCPKIPRSDRLRVGLKLQGNPEFEHEQFRKFPPELMLGLTDLDAEFISLELEEVEGLINVEMGDWLDTAKLVASLDLVITSCTGVAHLSAAMGVPTWVVVPVMPYYVHALPGDTSPWYATMSLYRQEKFGCWEAPFKKVRKDLGSICESR